ncbi:hypothetical protein PVK06_005328 [Gossypium arboreum]|uniref:Uncharacterized protein n=1 Tax=Gossypium arboreum TaxID=29729 RepID=A0ABR0QUS7_GOSAR|nr:hypothetical protein PVK06_005328 [Gossypium arboreum]
MTSTPLLNMLTENKLNENNSKEWKWILIIVLTYRNLKIVLDNKCPPTTQIEARKSCEESNEIACRYMLASVTRTLYKQLESYKTAKAILDKLEDMSRGQAALAQ